jgi:hypothetical protein
VLSQRTQWHLVLHIEDYSLASHSTRRRGKDVLCTGQSKGTFSQHLIMKHALAWRYRSSHLTLPVDGDKLYSRLGHSVPDGDQWVRTECRAGRSGVENRSR